MTSSASGGLSARRRAMLAVGITLVVWAVIVLTHQGEFWPFSIYPMFARAGQPWTNALVLEVPHVEHDRAWGPWTLDSLPGTIYPTSPAGVSALDLSQMVKLTSAWTDDRIQLLRKLFAPALAQGRSLMLVRADGRLLEAAEVQLTGVILLTPEGSELHPRLRARP